MGKLVDVSPFRRRNNEWEDNQSHHLPSHESRFRKMFKKIREWLRGFWPINWRVWLGVLVALAVLWKLLVVFGVLPSWNFPAIDKNKRQAVFLGNGQVYFGYLREVNREYVKLTDTYYLQVAQQLQPSQPQQQLSLVKLSNEIHSPEDGMYIPKSQILFWENLKSDSQVVQTIKQDQGSQ